MARQGRWAGLLAAAIGFAIAAVLACAPAAMAAPVSSSSQINGGCPRPGGLHRFGAGPGRTVALTFDDGPGRDARRIMDILRQQHVTATFFNIGEHEAADPQAVRAMHAAGFALGDHTWDHRTLRGMPRAQQAAELDRERRVQSGIVGGGSCLLRPPGGEYDATTLSLAAQRGMTVWNWSVDTEDWKGVGNSSPYWVDRIRTRAEAGAGLAHPVILMHDEMGGNPATVAALPDIIAFYRDLGYRFVDLLGRSAPGPAPARQGVGGPGSRTTPPDAASRAGIPPVPALHQPPSLAVPMTPVAILKPQASGPAHRSPWTLIGASALAVGLAAGLTVLRRRRRA